MCGINHTAVTDLTPLRDMQLKEMYFTPKNITKGMEILKEMKSLDSIGSKGYWRGPLTYMARMTADDATILQNWAGDGLDDDNRGRIEATVDHQRHSFE